MTETNHFQARLAKGATMPTLLCGHCGSILPRGRIVRNESEQSLDTDCRFIGLCAADDCGAVNCCDQALAEIDNPDTVVDMAF